MCVDSGRSPEWLFQVRTVSDEMGCGYLSRAIRTRPDNPIHLNSICHLAATRGNDLANIGQSSAAAGSA